MPEKVVAGEVPKVSILGLPEIDLVGLVECSWKQREGDGKVLVAKFRSPPNSLDFVEIASKILEVESDAAEEVQNKLVNLSFEAFLKQAMFVSAKMILLVNPLSTTNHYQQEQP